MKNVFILLLLGTASLFCIACSGENSVLTDGDAVLLQPGVHAGATLASTRSMINDVGTGADRISTIGIYLAAADGSLYPSSNAGGAIFTKATSGANWTSTPSTYVSLAKATPASAAITSPASASAWAQSPARTTIWPTGYWASSRPTTPRPSPTAAPTSQPPQSSSWTASWVWRRASITGKAPLDATSQSRFARQLPYRGEPLAKR